MPRKKRTTSDNFGRAEKSTPLDAAQRAIAEQEAKLRAQMEKYQKLIDQAPKLAEERDRIRREQARQRATHIERRFGNGASLPDRRFELNAGLPARQRRLRQERNRGRMMFFLLLLVFIGTVLWAYFTLTQNQ
jgi:hypothetical protein